LQRKQRQNNIFYLPAAVVDNENSAAVAMATVLYTVGRFTAENPYRPSDVFFLFFFIFRFIILDLRGLGLCAVQT
jgi:hypothetical protein